MGTASFPAPSFGQERYSGQQEKAPNKTDDSAFNTYVICTIFDRISQQNSLTENIKDIFT